jgi:hypothetical protein
MRNMIGNNIRTSNTFSASRPIGTHWRIASCKEVDCLHYLAGWQTKIDISTVLGREQYDYIINKSGKKGTGKKMGNMVTFEFSPGQKCFREHKIPLERDPILSVQKGYDRRIVRPGEWHDEMNESIHKRQQDVGK